MDWDDHEWLDRRQAAYDRLLLEEGGDRANPGPYAFEIHLEVVARLDLLPYSEGGRVLP